jgi:hypothetical protein
MSLANKLSITRAAIVATSARWSLPARQARYDRGDLQFWPKAATISLRISRAAIGRSEGAQ